MLEADRLARIPVYEVVPFRNLWIVRRRGGQQETLHASREQAIDRARALCRRESRAELVIIEPDEPAPAGSVPDAAGESGTSEL
jgi:hypothetical protein